MLSGVSARSVEVVWRGTDRTAPSVSAEGLPTIAPLTGIRFVAAIFVFNAHVPPPAGAPAILSGLSLAGHDWMTMFFVLSGLILTWNYDTMLGERTARALRIYYVARFARIYPVYILVLTVVVLSTVHHPADVTALLSNPVLWLHVIAQQTWSGDLSVAYGFNGPGWSIGVELFLYALFPLLLIPMRRIRDNSRALLIVAAIAILVVAALTVTSILIGIADLPRENPLSGHRFLYRTPLTRLPDFVLGICLGYLLRAIRGRDLVRIGRALQAVGAALVVGEMLIPPLVASVWALDSTDMIPFGLLLFGLAASPRTALARVLSSGPMLLLGESSYAFYLWHQSIVNVVGRADGSATAWVVTWIVAFVLTTFVAVGTHVLFESPARSWLRRALGPPVLVDRETQGHGSR
jgi:peptidoglycan/LPS O-acetylase OafA/YrhL